MALALELFLEIEASPAPRYSIVATGRSPDICSGLRRNLLLQTYEALLSEERCELVPLALSMVNGIPVGMGCGSSAAVRLAGVALASIFGGLDWDGQRIVDYTAGLEGHPDNVAACWHGGLTIAAGEQDLAVVSIAPPANWGALVVLPDDPVATAKARSILPQNYARQDVVLSLQRVALLTASVALGRADLMPVATQDCLHQPYRSELCPLLLALLTLAGQHGVMSVTLSGAGPAVLLLTEAEGEHQEALRRTILELTGPVCPVEIVPVRLCRQGAEVSQSE